MLALSFFCFYALSRMRPQYGSVLKKLRKSDPFVSLLSLLSLILFELSFCFFFSLCLTLVLSFLTIRFGWKVKKLRERDRFGSLLSLLSLSLSFGFSLSSLYLHFG